MSDLNILSIVAVIAIIGIALVIVMGSMSFKKREDESGEESTRH